MKTNLSFKVLFVVAALSITVLSCNKDALTPDPVVLNKETVTPSVLQLGDITDLGFVNPDAKKMLTSMVVQNFTVLGPDDEVRGQSADFNFNLYSNEDGLLPEGTYTFSISDTKEAFTFDIVNLYASLPPESVDKTLLEVVGGTIDVVRFGSSYGFSLNLDLASGQAFNGSSKGMLLYKDI